MRGTRFMRIIVFLICRKTCNLLIQSVAICFVCGCRECSKLQFFEVPVTHREKRYVLLRNTICAKSNCEARQKAFWFFFSKKNNSYQLTFSPINQNLTVTPRSIPRGAPRGSFFLLLKPSPAKARVRLQPAVESYFCSSAE